MMTKADLLKFDKIVKMLKSQTFIIRNDRLIGCDKTMVVVTELEYINNIVPPNQCYEYNIDAWNNFIKAVKEEDIDRGDYTPWIQKFSTKRISMPPTLTQWYNMKDIQDKFKISLVIDNFQDTEEYMRYSALRADDGAHLFKIDRQHMFYLSSGLLPANKGDKIRLEINDMYWIDPQEDGTAKTIYIGFLANFYIAKKGGLLVHRGISYRSLC